jgi:hypothetical protein
MFTGKGNTNSASMHNTSTRSNNVVRLPTESRLDQMIKRDPQVGVIAASWSKPELK